MVNFTWNVDKARSNLNKHKVSFDEAKSVFFDEHALQFFDQQHSADEDRFIMLGLSNESRLLVVCHCEREHGNTIRIISARKATRNERVFYEGE